MKGPKKGTKYKVKYKHEGLKYGSYEYHKSASIKHAYGITLDQYNKLFEDQKGCCAICNTHQAQLVKSLCIDHDHETGKIRGLLCDKCNKGIGLLGDNQEVVSRAAEYLKNNLVDSK